MLQNNSAVIQQFSRQRSTIVSASRFFNNHRVQIKDLIECSKDNCGQWSIGRDVIVLHDTTDFNYWHHRGRIKQGTLGSLEHEIGLGYHAHCGLAIDAQDDFPIGYSHLEMWVRKENQPNKRQRQYQKLAIEEKESFRWINTINQSAKVLEQATSVTYVADRECDIYELWDRCGKDRERSYLVVRARVDRRIQQGGCLFSHIATLPVMGIVDKEVRDNKKKKRSKHKAALEIRFSNVTILAPEDKKGQSVNLWVVEAKESSQTVKQGEPPVHWILLTTKEVSDIERAKAVIGDYCKRWWIEMLFSATKTRGVNLEESQLEDGQALMKLGVMAFQTVLKILQLKHQRDAEGQKSYSVNVVFDQQREELLKRLIPQWEGKTEKQKNPYKKGTLPWASWLIARLGGWKGYKRESPPGIKTFSNGIKRFEDMFLLYQIMTKKNVCID